jgi:hypothetical protein
VLGAWKFQQGKFCNFGKYGLGILGNSVFVFSQGRLLFSSQERATCVRKREKHGRTCEEERAAAHVEEKVQPHVRLQQVRRVTCVVRTWPYSHTCD